MLKKYIQSKIVQSTTKDKKGKPNSPFSINNFSHYNNRKYNLQRFSMGSSF